MAANEAIPLYDDGPLTVLTDAAVVGKTFVDAHADRDATTGLIVVRTCAPGAKALGVAAYDIASGAQGVVWHEPGVIIPVTADGTGVTVGDQIAVASGGVASTFARTNSGSAAFNDTSPYAVGKAVSTAAPGADVLVKLY